MNWNRRDCLKLAGTAAASLAMSSEAGATENRMNSRTAVERYRTLWLEMMGPFPDEIVPLRPEMKRIADIGGFEAWRISFLSEADDRVPGYLIVPGSARKAGRSPVMICIHSTTEGSGKDRIAGLAGARPEDPPDPPATSRAYGLELARWGYAVLCFDLICDGERIPPGTTRYDTCRFYEKHPEWSAVGKNIWDVQRSIDFLETLDFVDRSRIGCVGHSLGGHSSLFAAAFDRRIAAVCSNGGALAWQLPADHWSRPMGGGRGPVRSYVYLPRFRKYVDNPDLKPPVDFEHLMMMVAPRPLLVMASEGEVESQGLVDKYAAAFGHYHAMGAGDRIGMFSYPGKHSYPPVAKRHSFNWFDRWFDHTPAVPTLWPDALI